MDRWALSVREIFKGRIRSDFGQGVPVDEVFKRVLAIHAAAVSIAGSIAHYLTSASEKWDYYLAGAAGAIQG